MRWRIDVPAGRRSRRRVQEQVDRRFNRSRYDAARTVEGFSRQLRGAGDASDLYRHLQKTAATVLQPAHVSLWLRDGEA